MAERNVEFNPDRNEQFVALFAQNQCRLFGYVVSLVQNIPDAEEVMQQTSITLWRKFDQFQLGTDFFAWAAQVAQYTTLNYLRSQRRTQPTFSPELIQKLAETHAAEAHRFEPRLAALRRCLERLRPRDRRLIELCYEGNRSIKDAAQLVGRTADSVYHSLTRIRSALQRCIQGIVS